MMTDFRKKWAERRKKWEQQEKERTGDIYAECIARGCDKRFLEAFDTRIWLFPVEQTKSFHEISENGYVPNIKDHMRQWKIYLQVILEKRPDNEKADDWKQSLELLQKYEIK